MNDKSYTTATDREVMQAIGERLTGLRKARGMTQKEAAERAGLSRSTLHRAEKGDNPTLLTLVRLLRVFGRVAALELLDLCRQLSAVPGHLSNQLL